MFDTREQNASVIHIAEKLGIPMVGQHADASGNAMLWFKARLNSSNE